MRLKNLEAANSQNLLWPTIADAADAYIRRRVINADNYERLWRLLHIWEATAITLGSAAMVRLREEAGGQVLLRRCRELYYGKSWDALVSSFHASAGAAEGSLEKWAAILQELSKMRDPQSGFLRSLSDFLNRSGVNLNPFIRAWHRTGDLPPDAERTTPFQVKDAIHFAAVFRQRFANVPFPCDPLESLRESLENLTDQMFIAETGEGSESERIAPFFGGFGTGRSVLRGSAILEADEDCGTGVHFIFRAGKKTESTEKWPALSFIWMDSMMRPHLLTRLRENDSAFIGEFTRFRAEANALVERPESQIRFSLPPPKAAEYDEEDASSRNVLSNATEALEAIRQENYDPAIAFLSDLTTKQPGDHLAWLRLGFARREKAIRNYSQHSEEVTGLLLRAIDDLTKACQHSHPDFQARAYYERSKTYYCLDQRMLVRRGHLDLAYKDAVTASRLMEEAHYHSWMQTLSTAFEADEPNHLSRAQRG
jgi:hypothetical protein